MLMAMAYRVETSINVLVAMAYRVGTLLWSLVCSM